MGWEDRLRGAAYTSPNGVRIIFQYEDVIQTLDARGTAFDFPNVDGVYVQRTGLGAREIPLTAFFSGDDHDLQSDAFMAALGEEGIAKLEHPRYGSRNVVPLGKFSQRDDLKTAANQSVVEVTLWETTGAIYPTAGISPIGISLAAVANFNVVSIAQFGRTMRLGNAISRANTLGTIASIVSSVRRALRKVAATSNQALRSYQASERTLTIGLDTLIGQPLNLATRILDIIQSPARSLSSIEARLSAYAGLIADMLGISPDDAGDGGAIQRARDATSNNFHSADHSAMAAVTGSVISCLDTTFQTRRDTLAAAEQLLSQLELVVAWRDERTSTLDQVDTGESYQALQESVALAAGYLIQTSFSLLPERHIVLDRARTILDVCAQLYGTAENERLDYLINTNSLTGSEILELPRGKSIVYYA